MILSQSVRYRRTEGGCCMLEITVVKQVGFVMYQYKALAD